MAGTTPKRALPYPNNADVPNIAGDIQALATAVDTELGSHGKSIIATAETRTNTAYGTLTTPDEVTGLVLPTGGLIAVAYQAYWKSSVSSAGRAAVFIGSAGVSYMDDLGDHVDETSTAGTAYNQVAVTPHGIRSSDDTGADRPQPGAGVPIVTGPSQVGAGFLEGGPMHIWNVPAGTYTVGIRFKSASGTVTVKNRNLWAWTLPF